MAVWQHQARCTRTDLNSTFFYFLSIPFSPYLLSHRGQSSLTCRKILFISNLHHKFGFSLATHTCTSRKPGTHGFFFAFSHSLQRLFWTLVSDMHRGKKQISDISGPEHRKLESSIYIKRSNIRMGIQVLKQVLWYHQKALRGQVLEVLHTAY